MRSALAAALAAPLLLVACSGSPESASPTASTPASAPAAEDAVPEEAAPAPAAPKSVTPVRPSAEGMATDRLADAVLEQLKIDSPDTFTDQLITIALSPLMRQFASTADVTTRVDSQGPKVKLTLAGAESTCVITVTDEPRARGVVCKQV
jgi:hypothetical protein